MKKLLTLIAIAGAVLLAGSCKKNYLDLKPLDQLTEASYFTTPDQFKAAASDFYNKMISWQSVGGSNIYDFMDFGSDISSNVTVGSTVSYGRGSVNAPNSDIYWDNTYAYIRNINILLSKANVYAGNKSDIKQYVAEAKFFRAWQHFFLLKRFGGVPIVTTVLDLNSPGLTGPRNSRYEVVNQILSDLNDAIAGLPTEQAIPSADKGRISKWAAEAFKARVELYEATWRKYTGVTTDFKGSAGPTADQVSEFLTDAAAMAKDVMDNGGYQLWNYNSTLNNRSAYYLFSIDGSGSNPLNLDKTSNNEFILKSLYDFNLRQGGINLTHTVQAFLIPSRKMMDMYLCSDGLPVDKSPLFQGYHTAASEYQNRDFRLYGYVLGYGALPASGSVTLNGAYGYGNQKFAAYNYPTYRNDNQESQDYPQIRLAEVYLIYAEAKMELNGSISDADLNISLNLVRARAGVAPLTNALAAANGLDIGKEIRRERTIELWGENSRFDDLKRWGTAEQELNQSICGAVVGSASYPTDFKDASGNATQLYSPNLYVYGETAVATGKGNLNCVTVDAAANRNFKRINYLFPIPLKQIQLNTKLVQNNGY
ncbi:RagB/SusD family nutrient uptake outer membrane protein [Mucilaginibacter rubeus]|uniref:RagB/SusD family nutrient uptake outer membrane protein n=1 Tax=Mucilaginibacter rubeus TaxID=2027860 RepID=A0AAE6ML46_9SPHI|nr:MULTISPECIES: RagB/SusD family nutrient uptake outer membrane protein [Mucilaginibacter]QEM07174.1 RagB/SusD family nutrient uptake outer membrane protein [Mucilaginibacter rubeus]QEM19630.1 RagB/SusD family nutrient uptake outer membrane protein [Mucilaginibacter gossypii]QTE43677.1 RagB/SusD family nutrient uptake outer membrane protein [Mucilaginibacter rubeus]QTE50277.1 RagB/SusD family nutrient uptake outer membrane protein [Mucilaginibacter rubeus]QTE55364.1 RagB/SusD family nutrient 